MYNISRRLETSLALREPLLEEVDQIYEAWYFVWV
jgi:hypothetical protein